MPYTLDDSYLLTAEGDSMQEALISGARGLFDCICKNANVRPETRVEFAVQAKSSGDLFEEWLSGLLEQRGIHGLEFGDFEVASLQKLDDGGMLMMGVAVGQPFEGETKEVKGIKKGSGKCTEGDKVSCHAQLEV